MNSRSNPKGSYFRKTDSRTGKSHSITSIDANLSNYFTTLIDPGMARYFFRSMDQTFQSERGILTVFTRLLMSLCRYHNFSRQVLWALVEDNLQGLSDPSLMFSGDHFRVLLLAEHLSQTLGSTLTTFLTPCLSVLASLELSFSEISLLAIQLLALLSTFRFPSEAGANVVAISEGITLRFPGYEQSGCGRLFFLAYLCPLILNSPQSFRTDDTPAYRQNSLRLVQVIKSIAGRAVSGPNGPLDAAHTEVQDQLMAKFLSQLASSTGRDGAHISFASLTCPSMVPTELEQFVDILARWGTAVERALKSETGQSIETKKSARRWIAFLSSWNSNRSTPSPQFGQGNAPTNLPGGGIPTPVAGLLSNSSRHSEPSMSKASSQCSKNVSPRSLSQPILSSRSSRSTPPKRLHPRKKTHLGKKQVGSPDHDPSHSKVRFHSSSSILFTTPSPSCPPGSISSKDLPEKLDLFDVICLLQDTFIHRSEAHPFIEELSCFFGIYSLFIEVGALIDFLFITYLPTLLLFPDLDEVALQPVMEDRYRFISIFFRSWVECDPRLVSLYSQLARHISDARLPLLYRDEILESLIMKKSSSSSVRGSIRAIVEAVSVENRTKLQKRVLKTPASEMALNLELSHMSFLRMVYPWEVVSHTTDCPISSCFQVSQHFNRTVAWVQSMCLLPKKARSRTRNITRWISIADSCYHHSYLSPLLMIVTALSHQVISRLKQTWQSVPAVSVKIFVGLQTVCTPVHNYRNLRKFRRASGVSLPLAIIVKDVTAVLEILPGHEKNQLRGIPYDKFRHLGMILERSRLPALSDAGRPDPQCEPFPQSKLFLLLADPVPRLIEDRLYQLSYLQEPPAHAQEDQEVLIRNPLIQMEAGTSANKTRSARSHSIE